MIMSTIFGKKEKIKINFMAYINKEYFLRRIKLALLNELTNSSDENLDDALKSADDMIDSYLRNKIKVLPLSNPPDMIKRCSFDIAHYLLHDRTQSNQVPANVITKYDTAVEYLKAISSGNVQLTTIDTIPEANKESTIEVTGEDLKMSRDMF